MLCGTMYVGEARNQLQFETPIAFCSFRILSLLELSCDEPTVLGPLCDSLCPHTPFALFIYPPEDMRTHAGDSDDRPHDRKIDVGLALSVVVVHQPFSPTKLCLSLKSMTRVLL